MGKNLYIAFVDYAKAFDTIWRKGLWYKLVKEGIKGKFLNIVKNMYTKCKSCVLVQGERSNFFPSYAGVRQGEILSPLLFAFYINDLENFLKCKKIVPLQYLSEISEKNSEYLGLGPDFVLDLLALYYADDTILMAETPLGLQNALNELYCYCQNWKLAVNEDKTKIICFTKKKRDEAIFTYNNQQLENVNEFVYLGVTLTKTGISKKSVEARVLPTHRAIFSTLSMCRASDLPIDLTLEMFHKIIAPCTLYGAELYGFLNCSILETLQLKYLKYSLKLKKSTSTLLLLGETGFLPLEYYIKIKMINFWITLISGQRDKISFKIYILCLTLFNEGKLNFEWLEYIKSIIIECGLSYVFTRQLEFDLKWLKNTFLNQIKVALKSLILQKWGNEVENASKCFYYRHFHSKPTLQKYLKILPENAWLPILKLRTANHKFPIEIYSWSITFKDRMKRLCTLCQTGEVGDEYHYVLICPVFLEARKELIQKHYYSRPSVFKFLELINSENKIILVKLAKFLKIVFSIFK